MQEFIAFIVYEQPFEWKHSRSTRRTASAPRALAGYKPLYWSHSKSIGVTDETHMAFIGGKQSRRPNSTFPWNSQQPASLEFEKQQFHRFNSTFFGKLVVPRLPIFGLQPTHGDYT